MISGYIGCPKCGTCLFAIEAKETQGDPPSVHTGVFEHVLSQVADPPADPPPSQSVCAVCEGALERVPPPEEARPK
jgi:predicted  nucleic acid-binding Zn-ribbon protein